MNFVDLYKVKVGDVLSFDRTLFTIHKIIKVTPKGMQAYFSTTDNSQHRLGLFYHNEYKLVTPKNKQQAVLDKIKYLDNRYKERKVMCS